MYPQSNNGTYDTNKQKLYVIQESESGSEKAEGIQQNYNYPYQPYPQIYNYAQAAYPQHQQQANQQQNNFQQYQQYAQVIPGDGDEINPSHFHNGQKKAFAVSVVSIWILQLLIELTILYKYRYLTKDTEITIPCSIAALIILILTVCGNHPNHKRGEINCKDQIFFFIFITVDIFTNFAIYYFITYGEYILFLILFRIYQFGNLVCSMPTLLTTKRELKIRSIIIITVIPFIVMIMIAYWISNELKIYYGWVYFIPFSWQVIQFVLTFNLIKLLKEIYTKKNRRIDINNIYTGFILFKFSFYIPC